MGQSLGLWLIASLLSSPSSVVPINLSWNAPKTCEGPEFFYEQVGKHLHQVADTSPVTVTINIQKNRDLYSLTLTQDGNPRELEDPSCESLIEAAGLIVALWLRARPPPRPNPIRAQLTGTSSQGLEHGEPWLLGTAGGVGWPGLLGTSLPQFELYLGKAFGKLQMDLGFCQFWPNETRFEEANTIRVQSSVSLLRARIAYEMLESWQIFLSGSAGIVNAESFGVENAIQAFSPIGLGGGGVRFFYAFSGNWRVFLQSQGSVLLFEPRFTISNLGNVFEVQPVDVDGKIGLEFYFR